MPSVCKCVKLRLPDPVNIMHTSWSFCGCELQQALFIYTQVLLVLIFAGDSCCVPLCFFICKKKCTLLIHIYVWTVNLNKGIPKTMGD